MTRDPLEGVRPPNAADRDGGRPGKALIVFVVFVAIAAGAFFFVNSKSVAPAGGAQVDTTAPSPVASPVLEPMPTPTPTLTPPPAGTGSPHG